jgi:hypothetical protein
VEQIKQLGVPTFMASTVVIASVLVHIVTIVLFLQWLHRLVTLTRQLGNPTFWIAPSTAVWSFFIPILNLFRPYQILRDAQFALSTETLPEPPPRPATDAVVGYRESALALPAPSRSLPNAFLGWWWGFYLLHSINLNLTRQDPVLMHVAYTASGAFGIASGVFAILVVARLTTRVQERLRRLESVPPQTLQAAGIFLA